MVEMSGFLLMYFIGVILPIGVWFGAIVCFVIGALSTFFDEEWGWFVVALTCAVLGIISLPLMFSSANKLHHLVVDKEKELPTELVTIETRRYKLLEINPPKHMKVYLEDVQSKNAVWASVGKHCNNWRDNEIGAEYNIDVKVLRKGDREWREFTSLRKVFC